MQNYDGQFKLNGQEYFYRAKDDSGSSKITRVNNEEHHYRMVEITNKETGNYDIIHFLRREMLDFMAFPVFFVTNLLLVQRKKYYFNRATVSRNCSIVL